MRFGKTLKTSVYPLWEGNYIEYHKLKKLLREHEAKDGSDQEWTEEDEETFVQELVNVQLDKVNSFQVNTYKQLRDRTSECESELEPLTLHEEAGQIQDQNARRAIAQATLDKLDNITQELGELEKFSRINFTGFLKAAKKHDRKRGTRYKVRPLLQVRLSQLPFNSEDYSPLLYRLSAMYSFVRQMFGDHEAPPPSREGPSVDVHLGGDAYTSHKFWVHMDNLLEVKTYILRRLPVLLYNPNTSKELDMSQADPTLTSLYFDNRKFDLYNEKVVRKPAAGSLRLRWTGHLNDQPEIFLEKKVMSDGDSSREVRVRIKKKHVQSFLKGNYKFEKTIHKMETQDSGSQHRGEDLRRNVDEIQGFIRENQLEPVLRANYTRTAFQIPGDGRVRISLDTDLALIREDALDLSRPCRDPEDWHRGDIDDRKMEFPFDEVKTGEIARFPHALLEIKIRGDTRRRGSYGNEWVTDLMASHLVKEAPRFSKFVHGVAELFEDHVNSFPFWLSELDTDIRRDPEIAFQEEQEKLAKRAQDEIAVGSFIGKRHSISHPHPMVGSPISRFTTHEEPPPRATRMPERADEAAAERSSAPGHERAIPIGQQPQEDTGPSTASVLRSKFPKFSMSKYALAHRQPSVALPPGVHAPGTWIKDTGPVRVEAKVWLANQRTFIKWQHICILLSALSLGLFNSAGGDNSVARGLAFVYTGFAVFAGVWGWWMYVLRARLIRQRSGRDLDNVAGPLVLCLGLSVALVLNFWLKYSSVTKPKHPNPLPLPAPTANSSVFSLASGIDSDPDLGLVNQAGTL